MGDRGRPQTLGHFTGRAVDADCPGCVESRRHLAYDERSKSGRQVKRARSWLIAIMALPFGLLCLCQFSYTAVDFSLYLVGVPLLIVAGFALLVWAVRWALGYRRRL